MRHNRSHASQQESSISITSSARATNRGGSCNPSCRAAFWFTTNSNSVGVEQVVRQDWHRARFDQHRCCACENLVDLDRARSQPRCPASRRVGSRRNARSAAARIGSPRSSAAQPLQPAPQSRSCSVESSAATICGSARTARAPRIATADDVGNDALDRTANLRVGCFLLAGEPLAS